MSGLNPDMVTMAAINWQGDGALQGLINGINMKSMVVSGLIVGAIILAKGKKWKMGTFGVLTFATFFLVTGWVAPLINSLYGNGGNVKITGNETLSSMMNLTGAGTVIVWFIICAFIANRMNWGIGVGIIMTFFFSIMWVHWWLPLWHSTGIDLGGMSIPGLG